MRRPSSLPVWAQVAALAVMAVVMSQAVAFAVVVFAPDPRPTGFSISAAADALQGRPAETADGRALRRRLSQTEPQPRPSPGDLDNVIAAALAQRLNTPRENVRVWIEMPRRRPGFGGPRGPGDQNFIFMRRGGSTAERSVIRTPGHVAGEVRVESHVFSGGAPTKFRLEGTPGALSITADRLTFAPFSAAMLQPDGHWAVVEPPRGLLSPWQHRMLLALGISMLLLSPLVWWMARRLTRPIRVFAAAAERLGADPDAAPLEPSGPSEVRTAILAFNDMQSKLRGHMRQRTQTVAAIAHDLRTPLTRLRFRAEQAPEAVRDRMAADIEEMDALIAQAMAYVRGETPTDRREVFDLDALAADCAGGFAETGAAVSFDGGGILPVMADPAGLRRALANLVGNAVKYGGSARVRAFAEGGRAVVAIDDDGPGLADDELEAVFEPFHRAERSRNRETGGAGLGLTVARQAARASGGDVVLIRREPKGLTARLYLPLLQPAKETT